MSSYLSTTVSATNELLTAKHPKIKNILDWFGLPSGKFYSSMCLDVSAHTQSITVELPCEQDPEEGLKVLFYRLQHLGEDLDAAGVSHLMDKFGATSVAALPTGFVLTVEVDEIAAISVYTDSKNHGWHNLYVEGPWDEKSPFTLKAISQ